MKKNALLHEVNQYYQENSKEIVKKTNKIPDKSELASRDLYKKIKLENLNLLSANDKLYKIILSVLVLAIFINLTVLIEVFYQEAFYTKTILSAFSLFLILVFLIGFVFYSYVSDKMIVLNKYQEYHLKNIAISEAMKYKIKKEFDKDIKNLFELKLFLNNKRIKRFK